MAPTPTSSSLACPTVWVASPPNGLNWTSDDWKQYQKQGHSDLYPWIWLGPLLALLILSLLALFCFYHCAKHLLFWRRRRNEKKVDGAAAEKVVVVTPAAGAAGGAATTTTVVNKDGTTKVVASPDATVAPAAPATATGVSPANGGTGSMRVNGGRGSRSDAPPAVPAAV